MEKQHRLDVLLKKKADEGVKIYVLPWSETKIAIDLGSANVKAVLGEYICYLIRVRILIKSRKTQPKYQSFMSSAGCSYQMVSPSKDSDSRSENSLCWRTGPLFW